MPLSPPADHGARAVRHERTDSVQTPFWRQLQRESSHTYFVLNNGNEVYGAVLELGANYVVIDVKGRQPRMVYFESIAFISPTRPFLGKLEQRIQEPWKPPRKRRARDPIVDEYEDLPRPRTD